MGGIPLKAGPLERGSTVCKIGWMNEWTREAMEINRNEQRRSGSATLRYFRNSVTNRLIYERTNMTIDMRERSKNREKEHSMQSSCLRFAQFRPSLSLSIVPLSTSKGSIFFRRLSTGPSVPQSTLEDYVIHCSMFDVVYLFRKKYCCLLNWLDTAT